MLRYAVMIPSNLFRLCPGPSDVHFLEVHVRALSAQHARIGLHAKQALFGARSTRDVDQDMLARLHQVEPLTMNVLQVGIADGRRAPSARTCEKPCLVLELLHPRRTGAIYEVLPASSSRTS